MPHRRHHNNTGARTVRSGATRTQVRALAQRLGVTTHLLTIVRIVETPEELLLYGEDPDYVVIAPLHAHTALAVGDIIAYVPYGLHFGWLREDALPFRESLPRGASRHGKASR